MSTKSSDITCLHCDATYLSLMTGVVYEVVFKNKSPF